MAQVINNLSSRSGIRPKGLNGTGTSYIGEAVVALFNRIQDWSERRRSRNRLYRMPDYMLHDIGVTRADVETEWRKPFWRA